MPLFTKSTAAEYRVGERFRMGLFNPLRAMSEVGDTLEVRPVFNFTDVLVSISEKKYTFNEQNMNFLYLSHKVPGEFTEVVGQIKDMTSKVVKEISCLIIFSHLLLISHVENGLTSIYRCVCIC